jgi:hypothetical protein
MARNELMDPVELDEMARAFAKPLIEGRELSAPTTRGADVEVSGGVITARRCEVERDEAKILQRIAALAAAAGTHWLYAFPVKRKGGGTDRIEGLSIKGANNVARLYGNCSVDCRVIDAGASWVIYARFCDYETGFSLTRPFQQSKAGSRLGGEDDERRQQIALGIGVSKAERNVVVNALEAFCDYAFEEAKKDLVNKVGRRLDEYRQRVIDRLGALGVVTSRAERAVGRSVENWLAHDVARLIAEIKACTDGMSTAADTWPVEPPPEPRRNDAVETTEKPAAPATTPAADAPAVGAGTGDAPQERAPVSADESSWELPAGLVGQDAVIVALGALLAKAKSDSDVAEILMENAAAVGRITGLKKMQWEADVNERRRAIAQGGTP